MPETFSLDERKDEDEKDDHFNNSDDVGLVTGRLCHQESESDEADQVQVPCLRV